MVNFLLLHQISTTFEEWALAGHVCTPSLPQTVLTIYVAVLLFQFEHNDVGEICALLTPPFLSRAEQGSTNSWV